MKNKDHYVNVSSHYLPQLDGIRGIAILLVISFHYFGFLKIFSFGWIGVDLFFVLSGYLITSRLYASRNEKNYFSKFYINRALRIFPVYFLSLLIFYAALNFLLSKENLPSFSFYNHYWWSFVLFIENWIFIKEMPVQDHLLHFWSLAIEEQFYLIWPLFLFIFLKRKYFFPLLLMILAAIIITRCIIYFQHQPLKEFPYFFCNTFCRMDGFIIGGALYLLQQKKATLKLKFHFLLLPLLIGAGLFFTDTKQSNPFISTIGYTLLALFFAGLINYVTVLPGSVATKLLSAGWLKFIGKISYGLYIYHWIIYRVAQPRLALWLNNSITDPQLVNWTSLLLCLLVSIAVSTASYFLFENYFLKLKKR